MDEDIICMGCGSKLQANDPRQAGYLPASALAKAKKNGEATVYCQRCFKLRHYNQMTPVKLDNNDFLRLLNSLAGRKALIVNIVDLFDFSNSLFSSLPRFIGHNDFILVGNKFDLFPLNSRRSKIKDWMRQEANKVGLYPKKIFLISAARQKYLTDLIAYLNEAGADRDVYFIGMTNVGKSTLINAIIAQMGNIQNLVTASPFPGTTLDLIKIPLANGHFLIDTPGIMTDNQLATHLSAHDLALVSPQKPLKPATFQLNPGNSILLGGLGCIDYLRGAATSFVVYAARGVVLHRTKTDRAVAFWQKHRDHDLVPPTDTSNLPAFKGKEFHSLAKSDLLFGGIAFVTIPQNCVVKTWTPAGIGLGIRRALI